MPRLHLTDKKIRSLKTTKSYEDYWDAGFRVRKVTYGVRVRLNGSKIHTVRYRTADGKQRRMMLGEYPETGLADAHEKARAIASNLDGKIDPATERDQYKVAETFAELADLYLKLHASQKKKPRGYQEDLRLINLFLKPEWEHIKACDVRRKDVIALLDYIHVERGAPIQANRVHALIHKIFNFALAREIVPINPCAGLPKVAKENRRERVLAEDEITNLWKVLKQINEPTASLFKLILLTAQRPGEVKSMRWRDIVGEKTWHIPAEVTKNSRLHRVPLSAHAQRILADLRERASLRKEESEQEDTTGYDEYVFHHERGPHIQWLRRSTRKANELLTKEEKMQSSTKLSATADENLEHNTFTPHDLRRTAATFMRASGTSRDTLAKILNHKSAEHGVTGVYDRYDEWPEMEKALQTWGEKVDLIVKRTIPTADQRDQVQTANRYTNSTCLNKRKPTKK